MDVKSFITFVPGLLLLFPDGQASSCRINDTFFVLFTDGEGKLECFDLE
jgi:hypothetical protein